MSWVDRLLNRRMDRRDTTRQGEHETTDQQQMPQHTTPPSASNATVPPASQPPAAATGAAAAPQPDDAAAPAASPRRELPMSMRDALAAAGVDVAAEGGQRLRGVGRVDPTSPEAVERRRGRLQRRLRELRYDLGQAEAAHHEPNRWTERVDELTNAIAQAERDERAALEVAPGWSSHPLPPTPLTIDRIHTEEPAEVRFRIGTQPFSYREAIDWAERGHQKADVPLRRAEGEIDALLPNELPAERRDELRDHLAHGLGTLAEALRDAELERQATNAATATYPAVHTLADLAQPCPVCGGWRDFRGRCPACQQREWLAEQVRAETLRLIRERNEQQQELTRMRERRGLLLRQIADSEAELATLDTLSQAQTQAQASSTPPSA